MKKIKNKRKGSILLVASIAIIVWVFIAQALFITSAGGMEMIKATRVAYQAEQYAQIAVDRLKKIDYHNLDINGAHGRQAITGINRTGWEDEVIIGAESPIAGASDDTKQRIAEVNIYKNGDTIPRFTLEIPLSSQDSGTFPKGTILPYTGDLSTIPAGWALCDGKNGNPDLRDRFLVGAGQEYTMGVIGGSATTTLKTSNLPSNALNANIYMLDTNSSNIMYGLYNDTINYSYRWYSLKTLNSILLSQGWNSQPFDNRPPYYAVYWIIKI